MVRLIPHSRCLNLLTIYVCSKDQSAIIYAISHSYYYPSSGIVAIASKILEAAPNPVTIVEPGITTEVRLIARSSRVPF